MPKQSILKGSTSILVDIFIQDSSSTTGAGLTGLVFNTSSLVCYRARADDGNAGGTAITLATATLGTWTSGGFKEKDATNMPGVYEFGIPNNALASGSRFVLIMLKGATNMAPLALEIELTGVDNQDAVRYGLTALPNAAAEAAGGLFTRGTGAGQIEQEDNGKVSINVKQWLRGTIPAVNVTGVPLVDAKYLLGTIFSTPATSGIIDVNVKNIDNDAASASGTVTFPNATLASTTGAVGSVTGSVGSVTGSVGSVTTPVTPTDSHLIQAGTADSGSTNTIVLQTALGASLLPEGCLVFLVTGAGAGQSRTVASYVNSTKTITFDRALAVGCDNTTTYRLLAASNTRLDSSLKVSGVVLVDGVTTLTTYTGNIPQSGDAYSRLGAPAGASVSADIAAVKTVSDAVKVQTDKLTFTVANQIDANVLDWKSATAPAMTGDAFARIGAAGAGLTALGDSRIANLDDTITSRMATFTLPTNFTSLSIDASGRVKSQTNINKNVALAKFQFIMRDSTLHAPFTGRTVTVTRSIDNGSQAAGTLSAVTEIGFGMYSVDFASGDLNGNVIILRATATGCDDTFERIVTTP